MTCSLAFLESGIILIGDFSEGSDDWWLEWDFPQRHRRAWLWAGLAVRT